MMEEMGSPMSRSEGEIIPSRGHKKCKSCEEDDLRKSKSMGLEPRNEAKVDI